MRLLPTPATSMPSFAGVRLYPRTFAAARLGFLALVLGAFALGGALALGLRGGAGGPPDGARAAYTGLPPGAAAPELWLLDVENGAPERLLAQLDLPSAPVWSAEAGAGLGGPAARGRGR